MLKTSIINLKSKYTGMNIAVKASLWFTVCSIIQKGIAVITLPIFTRLMSTEQYGQYNIFLSWYNILINIITLNIHADIFNKGLIDHEDQRDKFTSNQSGLLMVLSTMFVVLYLLLRKPINNITGLSTWLMLVMVAEILANSIIGLWSARLRFNYDYSRIVTVTIAMSIINPIIGVISVLFSEYKAEARIISNAIVPILFSLGIFGSIRKKGGSCFSNLHWWKPVIVSAIPLIPHYLSLVLLNQSDKLMINHFSGASDAAFYSVAHSAGLLMTIINGSINGAFVPWAYIKMKSDDGNGIKDVTNKLFAVVMFVNLIVIWLAPEVIHILAAPQYAEAIWCLVPISMSVFFFFVYTLFADIEIYYGANHYIAIASVIAACLNIILNYIFVPLYGYIAAGYTTLISYCATMILHYIFLKHVFGKHSFKTELFDIKAIGLLTMLLCLGSAMAMVLYTYTWIRVGIAGIALMILALNRKKVERIFAIFNNKEE